MAAFAFTSTKLPTLVTPTLAFTLTRLPTLILAHIPIADSSIPSLSKPFRKRNFQLTNNLGFLIWSLFQFPLQFPITVAQAIKELIRKFNFNDEEV